MIDDSPYAKRAAELLAKAALQTSERGAAERAASVQAIQRRLKKNRSRERGYRVAWAIAALAVCVAMVGGIGRLWARRPSDAADSQAGSDVKGLSRRLTEAWDQQRRTAIRGAFLATGEPYAASTWRAVEEAFDRYAKAWIAAAVDARTARGGFDESSAAGARRLECLSDGITRLATLTDLYAAADRSMLERAAQAAQSLPAVAGCANSAAPRGSPRAPVPTSAHPQNDSLREDLARASAFELTGRYERGVPLATQALTRARALHSAALEAQADITLGQLEDGHGDWVKSNQHFLDAYAAAIIAGDDEAAAQAAVALVNTIGVRQRRFEEANRWAEVAKATVERVQNDDAIRAQLESTLSIVSLSEGRNDEALAFATRALGLHERVSKDASYRIAEAHNNLGRIYKKMARYDEALKCHEQALAINEAALGLEHPAVGANLVWLASVFGELGNHERALTSLDRARQIFERINPEHLYLEAVYNNTAVQLEAVGRWDEAFELGTRALEIFEKQLGASSYRLTVPLTTLGSIELDQDRPVEALGHFVRSLELSDRDLVADGERSGLPLWGIGEAKRRLGKLDEAIASFERSLAATEKALGPKHPKTAPALLGIGNIYIARHLEAKAIAPLERAAAVLESHSGDGIQLADVRFALARAAWSVGDRARAVDLATRARGGYEPMLGSRRAEFAAVTAWLGVHRMD